MVRDRRLEVLEPELRDLREHASLVRDRRRQHHVECRKPVRRDDEQVLADLVDVADLAAVQETNALDVEVRAMNGRNDDFTSRLGKPMARGGSIIGSRRRLVNDGSLRPRKAST